MSDASIRGGSAAAGKGGGIFVRGASSVVDASHTVVESCSAGRGGGGVAVLEASRVSISASQLISCSSLVGGGASVDLGMISLLNVTVRACHASRVGGALAAETDGILVARRTVLDWNDAGADGTAVHLARGSFADFGILSVRNWDSFGPAPFSHAGGFKGFSMRGVQLTAPAAPRTLKTLAPNIGFPQCAHRVYVPGYMLTRKMSICGDPAGGRTGGRLPAGMHWIEAGERLGSTSPAAIEQHVELNRP